MADGVITLGTTVLYTRMTMDCAWDCSSAQRVRTWPVHRGTRPSMSGTGAWSWLAVDASCSFVVRWGCDCTTRLRASPPATHSISISGICLSITRSHGCPHIGANGISWPPWKIDEKLKSENMQKKSSFLYVYVKILRAIRAGRCRERRYADHIFIQIYFRKHHFVVKFS